MKFSCLQENFSAGLSSVNHIAANNSTLPILNNVLLRAKKGTLDLVTTNLEIGIRTKIRAKIDKEGEFTIPAQLLTGYMTFLPNKPIDAELKESSLLFECGGNKTAVKGVSAEEFPLFPKIEKDVKYVCRTGDFKKGVQQVISAVTADEYRPEISGVLLGFNFTEGKITFAGTDSYRLAEKVINFDARSSMDDKFREEVRHVIVPTKTLQELLRILNKSETNLEIYISENQILFAWEDTELISRTISGQYPDYKQIIPREYRTKALIDINNLTRVVKSAGLFSQSGLNDIYLEFKPAKNKIIVKSVSSQIGENVSEIEADIEGEENSIVFNYRYLLDGLSNITTAEIVLQIIDINNPGVLRPNQDDSYLYIIMPIRQ